MSELRLLYSKAPEDWRTALAAVGGAYLIVAQDGRHYVGSAYGTEGFWGRWRAYAETGHGGNKKLKDILGPDSRATSQGFRFAILETADTSATREEIIRRESHWKDALGARAVGLNLN